MGGPFSNVPIEGAGGGGGVSGLDSADAGNAIADNEVIRGDGTTGIQGSDVLIADVATNQVDIGPTTGNQIQITGSLASGGDLLLRSTSHATKGSIQLGGATYSAGAFFPEIYVDPDATNVAGAQVRQSGGSDSSFTDWSARSLFSVSGSNAATKASAMTGTGVSVADGIQFAFANDVSNAAGTKDAGFVRNASGVVRVTDGSTGVGALNSARSVIAEVTSPETVAVTDSRKAITNEGAGGAVTYNLPAAVAGLEYIFIVQAAQNMVVTAAGGDTIRVAAGVSSAGGTATNGTVGGVLHLLSINGTEWIAIASTGTWTLA